ENPMLLDLDDSYAGTTLEAQERRGEILETPEGVLWTSELIDAARARGVPRLKRILVAVDPSHSAIGSGDEAGIIVGALGDDNHAYVMDDRSLRGAPSAGLALRCVQRIQDGRHRVRDDDGANGPRIPTRAHLPAADTRTELTEAGPSIRERDD